MKRLHNSLDEDREIYNTDDKVTGYFDLHLIM